MVALVLGILGVASISLARGEEQKLGDLAFMAGCWRGDLGDGTTIEEHYTEPTADVMLGSSLLLSAKSGATQFFEVIVVTRGADGISMAPYPMGKASVAFKLVRVEGRKAVFENLAHDFPQVIVYESAGDGLLTARIEGIEKGKPKKASFPMKAVPCTGR